MDNDGVFVADTELEYERRSKNQEQGQRRSIGEEALLAAERGIDRSRAYREAEETPLLGDQGQEDEDEPLWPGSKDFEGLPWWKRPSIYWILPPFLLFALAFGGIMVTKLNLILTLICREYIAERSIQDPDFTTLPVVFGDDNPQCRIPGVQSRVAQFTLYGSLISGLLSAVVSPKLGALSDRYGRLKILVFTTFGMLLGEVITIIAATKPDTFHVNWILVGYALDGLCGSFMTGMAIANSYATDCTLPAKRNVAFGYFHGCLFTGVAVGPIIAGYIIKATGSVLSVFYIALGCHFIFIAFILLFIPESLTKRRQLAAQEKYRIESSRVGTADWVNQIRAFNLFEPLKILWPTGEGSNPAVRRNLVLLSAVDTTMFGVAMGSVNLIVIYVNYEFGWGEFESNIFVSIVNICRVTCLVIILPLCTRLVHGKDGHTRQRHTGSDLFDLSIIRLAVFFDMLGFVGYTLVRSGKLFILSGSIAAVGGMGSPTLQSALTKHVPSDRTGQLLGATGLLHALARVVAPTIFNAIYAATVGKYTQTVFVCLTVTFGVAFICSWFVQPHVYLEEQDPVIGDGGENSNS